MSVRRSAIQSGWLDRLQLKLTASQSCRPAGETTTALRSGCCAESCQLNCRSALYSSVLIAAKNWLDETLTFGLQDDEKSLENFQPLGHCARCKTVFRLGTQFEQTKRRMQSGHFCSYFARLPTRTAPSGQNKSPSSGLMARMGLFGADTSCRRLQLGSALSLSLHCAAGCSFSRALSTSILSKQNENLDPARL